MIFLYDVVFDEIISSSLAYTSQPYAEAMAIRPDVSYIPCDTSSREQTGNIIMFAQFEEGIYYLKLVKMRKVMTKSVTNLMTVQLFHHYLA